MRQQAMRGIPGKFPANRSQRTTSRRLLDTHPNELRGRRAGMAAVNPSSCGLVEANSGLPPA